MERLQSEFDTVRDGSSGVSADGAYFYDPTALAPDRGTDELEQALSPFAYRPFRGAQRKCMGSTSRWSNS